MNIRVGPQAFQTVPRTVQAHRMKFNPRASILDEVVAGLLWMALDLPEDVTRSELEIFAHQLVARIKFGAGEELIESELAFLQSGQLGRPTNRDTIRDLTGRVIGTVRAV